MWLWVGGLAALAAAGIAAAMLALDGDAASAVTLAVLAAAVAAGSYGWGRWVAVLWLGALLWAGIAILADLAWASGLWDRSGEYEPLPLSMFMIPLASRCSAPPPRPVSPPRRYAPTTGITSGLMLAVSRARTNEASTTAPTRSRIAAPRNATWKPSTSATPGRPALGARPRPVEHARPSCRRRAWTRTARPSAPPTCCEVLNSPDARPASVVARRWSSRSASSARTSGPCRSTSGAAPAGGRPR